MIAGGLYALSVNYLYYSEEWRAGASCILMSMLSCPALQYVPNAFTYDLEDKTLAELMVVGNMVKFCGMLT